MRSLKSPPPWFGAFMRCFLWYILLQFTYANKALKRRCCDTTSKLFVQHKYCDYDVIDFIYANQLVSAIIPFYFHLYLSFMKKNCTLLCDALVCYILLYHDAKFVQLTRIWDWKCLERNKKKVEIGKEFHKKHIFSKKNIRKNVAASHLLSFIHYFHFFFHYLLS